MCDHRAEEFKGRVKEAIGDLTDDRGLKMEGQLDQASAHVKQGLDDASDAVKKVLKQEHPAE